MYDFYKPLRNAVRGVARYESLRAIHAYVNHLQYGRPFPADVRADIAALRGPHGQLNVFEWQLDILAKEVILNAPERAPTDFRAWKPFATALNKLRDLEDQTSGYYGDLFSTNVLLDIHRVAHRQLPWRRRDGAAALVRYFKIFGAPAVDEILTRELGVGAKALYTIGLGLQSSFMAQFAVRSPIAHEGLGLRDDDVRRVANLLSVDMGELRTQIGQQQSYDQDYAYSFNPLRNRPLVRVAASGAEYLIAPVSPYLLWRFTEGVFYDLVGKAGFDHAFGQSFEQYVGEVLRLVTGGTTTEVIPESPYAVGKDTKLSVDWIVQGNNAAVFVECKTKKIRYGSKIALTDTALLDADLETIATAIFQTYKTLGHAKAGFYSHWRWRDQPVYPIVVTLEEWYAFGSEILPAIRARVSRKLVDATLPESLLVDHPFLICSVDDLESAIQIMMRTGVQEFMLARSREDKPLWPLHNFMRHSFPAELRAAERNLFREDLGSIHPALAD